MLPSSSFYKKAGRLGLTCFNWCAEQERDLGQHEGKPVDVWPTHAARLIKLTDRLLRMRTIWAEPAAIREASASETLQVWAPLAERAGLWGLKVRLALVFALQ